MSRTFPVARAVPNKHKESNVLFIGDPATTPSNQLDVAQHPHAARLADMLGRQG